MTHEEVIQQMDDKRLPFTERVLSENIRIRRFDPDMPEHLFKWHWDREDRVIEVLEDNDWRFQYDNEMPIPMLTGVDIKIPAGVIHRVIKGTTPLSVKILLD